MKFILQREPNDGTATPGVLSHDGNHLCETLEDAGRDAKIPGRTRIPAGVYEIKLRDAGGMTAKYADRYNWHRGMLHLQDVPGFTWVYIHTGNTHEHTDGCILVGLVKGHDENGNHSVVASRAAYEKVGKMITDAIMCGQVLIEIRD